MYTQLDLAINNINEQPESLDDEDGTSPKKYLKSLIIESNSTLADVSLSENISLTPTTDNSIFLLKIVHNGKPTLSYLDVLNPRFWILYSLDTSLDIKHEVKTLIEKNNSRLDYSWFSSTSLLVLSNHYSKTSFSMRFHNTFDNPNVPMKKLSIRLWAEDAGSIIQNLVSNDFIGKGACLSNIEVNHTSTLSKYVKSKLSMDGCINVSKGNSVNELLAYQQDIVEGHYSPIINEIESNFSTEYTISDGINVKGDTLSIKFKERLRVEDLERISNELVKGINPFRFVGFVNKISEEDYLLNILDTHTYNRFDLELFPDEMLINLPKNTCGNCVTRLFALCQERIDPRAELRGGGESLIRSYS